MKITMKAILINETSEQKQIIDNMMLVFCTAIRFSFKRLSENNIKITELEKIVANKYNLNIRQAKDAVESARQTIQSQKELVKMNYEEYSNKVKAIEKFKGIVIYKPLIKVEINPNEIDDFSEWRKVRRFNPNIK